MQLNETYAFVAVVRAGSFTAAGRLLGVPKSTLSKQVRRLEERLGARLLQRTTRKLSLTDTGEAYFSRCRQAVEDIEEAERVASDVAGRVTGKLRVAATAGMVSEVFGPLLPELRARYPELRVEFVLSPGRADLIEENIDVALRGAPALEGAYIARRLAGDTFHLYASPAYLARRGTPAHPRELVSHETLGHSFTEGREIPLIGPDGPTPVKLEPWYTANDFTGMAEVAAAGGGIGLMLEVTTRPFVASGELERVLPEWHLPGGHLWAIYPSKHHLSPKVRVFVDFLVEKIEERGALPVAPRGVGASAASRAPAARRRGR